MKTATLRRGVVPNPWKDACRLTLTRYNALSVAYYGVALDPGVNYFVLQLERLGCETIYSCQGHPTGFYVLFIAPDDAARRLVESGYFDVHLCKEPSRYSLRLPGIGSERDRVGVMKQAAKA
jgi:hypothetical protein